ncbi:cache domain-containing sensor histidine kinase [Paenibacillus sacheonensis]|uniref:HAMP domain-containing protein n=1 Tax=Paenibacillus sacheonensis TaxID=742054 RepID=A0A7X4YVE4_9BACL|nr:sensor histidine kinase [Paenibacillus sacheonensis]MBM7568494.1 two-component system sensor histidine kinase YesM [Paenibacillus sacheonensis]NBC72321.1 HAMP domain-containing protein [Paenibacillus sacheonensis]
MLTFLRKSNLASVGVKVFGFYAASILIIVTVMGYLSYGKSAEIIETKVGGMALQNVHQLSKRIDTILAGYEDRSMLVLGNKEIQKQLSGKFRSELERIDTNNANTAFLANLVNSRNDMKNIYLLGERGASFRYSPRDSFPAFNPYAADFSNTTWYERIRKAEGGIVYFGIGPSLIRGAEPNAKPVFSFGRAERDIASGGEVIGVLLYEVEAAEITDLLSEIDYDGSGVNVLVDNDGAIVGDKDGLLGATRLGLPLANARQGLFGRMIDGEKKLVVYNRLETADWTLVGMLRGANLMKEARDIRWYMLMLGLACFTIGILLAVFIAASVHRPLHRMIRAMRRAKNGDFDVRIADKREDEFGYLFLHFNGMVSRIKELINELYVQKLLEQGLQLKMLGSQINAHFLYNTLDSVHWIARINKVDDISTMVFGLSKYLRLSLSEGRDEVNVDQIVQLIDSYIMIQKVRYRDKFAMHLHVEETLGEYKVLKSIFQPIVENAIYHGLEKKPGKGRLDVSFHREGGCLKFVVVDDGNGMQPDKLSELQQLLRSEAAIEGSHFALRNINAQIQIAYGMQYGIEIDSSCGQGTRVELTIPLVKGSSARQIS